jgi:hypothetical protein
MVNPERYPYLEARNAQGQTLPRPLMPIKLSHETHSITSSGLLDTGATVSVLPYEVGLELGLRWSDHVRSLDLTGNLAQYEARGTILTGIVGQFAPTLLIFAWTRAVGVPLLLGQVNFFAEFDACFFHARGIFEVQPKR